MTEAQLVANRANAQFSTGPRTEKGKRRSSLNAFRHGLTGQIVIHTAEDQRAFQKHCDDIRGSLAPVGALETTLAQFIAEDYWRLNRARALENAVFTLGLQKNFGAYDDDVPNPEVETALALGRTWTQQNRSLQLLITYEQRIRQLHRKEHGRTRNPASRSQSRRRASGRESPPPRPARRIRSQTRT